MLSFIPGDNECIGENRAWYISSINLHIDRTTLSTQPVITATRALVYGVLGALCLISAVVLASIGAFRLLDLVLPGESWSAHLVLGGALCLLGAWLWSRRTP